MAKIKMYNVLGKEVGDFTLKSEVFGVEPHNQSMFDTVLSERAAARKGNHKTKTRAEVAGGGKKP
jgi:large subunit ribosomal protein L4